MLLICSFIAEAQSIENSFLDENWALKVKQLDDFVDRFNNKLNYTQSRTIVKNELAPDQRKAVLASLFNPSLVSGQELVSEFIKKVDSLGYQIIFGQTNIISRLGVTSIYKEKPFNFELQMIIESEPDGSMKWVIVDTFSPKYPWSTIEPNPNKFINPSNHNLRFSSLSKLINDGNDIQGIFTKDFKLDDFSILVHEILEGNLEIKGIKDLTYQLYILDEYQLIVKYLEGGNKISGWLISEINYLNNQ